MRAALDDLEHQPDRISAASWPAHFSRLDSAGLYSWWVDDAGASDLANGLGHHVSQGRIYAGQTGATVWPSGKERQATLLGRVGRNHLRWSIRSSTFRLTLASALREALGLVVEGRQRLEPASDKTLSKWIADHLEVAIHPFEERDALADLESRVLAELDPPLNIDGRPTTPIRSELTRLRATLKVVPR